MNFIEKILTGFTKISGFIVDGFKGLFNLIAKPLSLLFSLLDGVFYFITVLFNVVVKIIMIFVALFQFIGAIIVGFTRSLQDLLTPSFNAAVSLPSTSGQGLDVVLDVVDPIGILNIVPYICLAFVWGAFIMKILALFGGTMTAKGGD